MISNLSRYFLRTGWMMRGSGSPLVQISESTIRLMGLGKRTPALACARNVSFSSSGTTSSSSSPNRATSNSVSQIRQFKDGQLSTHTAFINQYRNLVLAQEVFYGVRGQSVLLLSSLSAESRPSSIGSTHQSLNQFQIIFVCDG